MAYSPDGSRLASASWDGTFKEWDAITGQELLSLDITRGAPFECPEVAFNARGGQVAAGVPDGTINIWDHDTGKLQHTLRGHTSWLNEVAFSPDGSTLASASTDGTVRVWNPATGELRFILEAKATTVGRDNYLAFVAGGDIY